MSGLRDDLLFHGASLNALGLRKLMDHVFETNRRVEARGGRSTPLCLWGVHGVGKTAIVEAHAHERGWRFAYCAPAQFEEMGDLHGLPAIEAEEGAAVTRFAPRRGCPGGRGRGSSSWTI